MKWLIWLALVQILATAGWLQKGYPWVRFVAAEIFQLEATVIGWFVLIPFCLAHAWETSPVPSIKDGARVIDRWKWRWVGFAFDNPEDGVSGLQALIWVNGAQVPYMPLPPFSLPPWRARFFIWWHFARRAYCWSALRNSSDQLKYTFAWADGPFKRWTLFGRPQHAGWQLENGFKVPVMSL